MLKDIKIIIANPAGNITALVEDGENYKGKERIKISNQIQDIKEYKVEQTGFIIKPNSALNSSGLWRLEMAGGEFCGNAARSFALLAAFKTLNATGAFSTSITISVSGCISPINANVLLNKVDDDYGERRLEGAASISISPPERIFYFDCEDRKLCAFDFDGITHIIYKVDSGQWAANKDEDKRKLFFSIVQSFYDSCKQNPPALGVMFITPALLYPAVYVKASDTLVFESSCGSGTAAYACCRALESEAGVFCGDVPQPGGIIKAQASAKIPTRAITELSIGGNVLLKYKTKS